MLKHLALLLATAIPLNFNAASPSIAAGDALSITGPERQEVVEKLADILEKRYLYPEVASRYSQMLRTRLARHEYDQLADPSSFASRLTADLQATARDLHLRVSPEKTFHQPRSMPADTPQSARPHGPAGLEAAEMLPGNVMYLRFNEFPDGPKVAAQARAFLLLHRRARALILDCRPNRGGGITVMNAILPLLYQRETTQVRMDTRTSAAAVAPNDPDPTLVRRPSPAEFVRYDHVIRPEARSTPLRRIPIYYLTSRRTASAAEHLAMALQRNHRATLVGERTAGANHFGDEVPLGAGLAAFIPVGRSYDPATGKDWEGVGISPDVAVAADDALTTALDLASHERRGSHRQAVARS